MFKALLRKQMSEIGAFLVQNAKTGKRRTTANRIGYGILLIAVAAMMFGTFGYFALQMCDSLCEVNLEWFYFALMGLIAIALGVFGSVFNTYASLYVAKDNEALLSMPIPSWMILAVRMIGVYVMGLAYESLVFIPTIAVYLIRQGFSVKVFILSILSLLSVSIVVLILSVALGWVVALITSRLKSKSFMTVLVSLAFIAAYYICYNYVFMLMRDIAMFGEKYATGFKKSLGLFYLMGKGCAGDVAAFLIFTVIALVVLAVCFVVLSKSFVSIATTNKGTVKKAYVEKYRKAGTTKDALLTKEFLRFTKSATYMLNCGLGIIFYFVAMILLLVKMDKIQHLIFPFFTKDLDLIPLVVIVGVCLIASTNPITAPSISLEGKSMWIVRTLPIPTWEILKAKLKLHCYLNMIPAVLVTSVMIYVLEIKGAAIFYTTAIILLFIFFHAMLGLILNLKNHNFSWSSESAPVKQSASVFISLFGGWLIATALGVGYVPIYRHFSSEQYLIFLIFIFAVINRIMLGWLKKKGVEIIEHL